MNKHLVLPLFLTHPTAAVWVPTLTVLSLSSTTLNTPPPRTPQPPPLPSHCAENAAFIVLLCSEANVFSTAHSSRDELAVTWLVFKDLSKASPTHFPSFTSHASPIIPPALTRLPSSAIQSLCFLASLLVSCCLSCLDASPSFMYSDSPVLKAQAIQASLLNADHLLPVSLIERGTMCGCSSLCVMVLCCHLMISLLLNFVSAVASSRKRYCLLLSMGMEKEWVGL